MSFKTIAQFCACAYEEKDISFADMGVHNFEYVTSESNRNDPQCYVFQLGDFKYFIFRGTSSFIDFVRDVSFRKKDILFDTSQKVFCHSGFLKEYMSIRDKLLKYAFPSENIIIAGHSLGGAMANLMAYDLADNFLEHSFYVYTFGCPKMFNCKGVDVFSNICANSFNFVNKLDIVTWLPFGYPPLPKIKLTNYGHNIHNYISMFEKHSQTYA